MKAALAPLVVLVALFSSGCAIQVHNDYPKYLSNNEGRVSYPYVGGSAEYYFDQSTANHQVKIKSWLAGRANTWIVRFGEVLDATMQGRDMQASFESLSKRYNDKDTAGLVLRFHLINYRFADFHSFVDMTVEAQSHGSQLLSKRYSATGMSQGGKMFWGGGFAMKNAIQQSTKLALDEILTRCLNDLKQALKTKAVGHAVRAS